MKNGLLFKGDSSVIYATATARRRVLFVCFDPMYVFDGDESGFGRDFLNGHGFDVISVRKTKENWFQDLTHSQLLDAVNSSGHQADDIICYGSSAGAYAALYYSKFLNARALALSPRLSIHPDYPELGHETYRKQVAYQHVRLKELGAHDDTRSLVLYDPKVAEDKLYIEKEIMPAFPSINYIKLPFFGHPCTDALSEMGLLKNIVLRFIDSGSFKSISRAGRRSKSLTGMRNLAIAALNRRKINFSMNICDRVLKEEPSAADMHRVKSICLSRIGKVHNAINHAAAACVNDPNKGYHQIHLADLLLRSKDFGQAMRVLDRAIELEPGNLNYEAMRKKIVSATKGQ